MWTTVGEISKSILYGVSESAKSKGEYKLLRITDIKNNAVDWNTVPYTDYDEHKANAYIISDGDILFARTGATVGKSYLVKGLQDKAIYASYLIRVQTFNEILPEYVKYFFESGFYWEQIQRDSIGIGQPNVNGTTLSQLALSIPPINEQHRIVNELGSWLNIIDIIDNGKAELQIAIKRVKSKILDLAIHGKLVPQDPNDEPASELLKRINPKAEITCDNLQYGKLPKGWCETTLGNTIVIKSGDAIKVRDNRIGKYPIYGGNGITGYNESYNVDGINIIIGRVGFYCGSVHYVNNKIWVTDNAFVTKIMGNVYTPKFLYYLLQQYDLKQYSNSTAQPVISGKTVYPINVMLPPLSEQYRIVARIEELFAQLDKIESSLQA
ncbi:restriction endonuclease subunit S [Prevotella copri]|uniref:Restriction endonuclease subunit S n=1 Tax=Segatella copri TaxID=165179 RepID=A0A6G1TYE1_9BACT|nr:restriction endonuclease subunit S [Segatella copri]